VFLVLRLKSHPTDRRRTTFDAPGLLLFIMFVGPVILSLEQFQHLRLSELPTALGLLAFAAASLVTLIWQEKRTTSPLIPPALFKEPSIWRCDSLAVCHGAYLVSLITFLPIYLRAVRGASPEETGLLLLPLMFGVALGSLITGQIMTRTGHTAIFPSVGLPVATLGLLLLAFWAPHLTVLELPWIWGGIAVGMGTVMSVVQLTVQAVSGPRRLGTGAAMVQFSRSVGAAFGTAAVTAVLFAVLAAGDRQTANLFGTIIEQGPEVIAKLAPARQLLVHAEIGDAFRAAFLTMAAFSGIATVFAWTMPLRRI
jgi:MFS family permease